jgi:hypothetical protein
MKVIIYNRIDRLGSNLLSKFNQIIYANHNKIYIQTENNHDNTPITYTKIWNKYNNCLNSIFNIQFNELIKLINNKNNLKYSESDDIDNFFKINRDTCLNTLNINTVFTIKQDLFSYFNDNLKKEYIELLEKQFENFELPWNKNDKIICLHIRLGDLLSSPKYRINNMSHIIHEYYTNKINKIKCINYNFEDKITFLDKNNLKSSRGLEMQTLISFEEINETIKMLEKKYPTYKIYIVSEPKTKEQIKLNYPIISNKNCDFDLWCLINSDILVGYKSVFPMIAAFLHKGEKIYLKKWSHLSTTGLDTIYDKKIVNIELLS